MASSSGKNRQLFPLGSITMLFSFQTSVVVLLDYDESETTRLLGIGQFVVYLMLQTFYPVMVTACSVDGFHWPIAKDTVIFRMATRTFAFALPGLLYGLQFPDFCDEALLDKLERLFIKFGHYFKVVEDKGLGYSLIDTEPLLWYKLRRRVEPTAHEVLRKLGQLAGKSRFSISNHNPSYLRAIRMSATTKLVVDTMVKTGTLRDSHMVLSGINPSPHQPDDPMSHDTAYASASVFTFVVDTLEYDDVVSSGDHAGLVGGCEPPHRPGNTNIGFKVWKFNEQGVVAFMRNLGPVVEQEKQMMREKGEKWRAKERDVAEANNSAASAPYAGAAAAGSSNDKGKGVMP